MFDSKSQKEAVLAGTRLSEVEEGSRNVLPRVANLEQADREVEAAIGARNEELEKMKEEVGSQIESLKTQVTAVKNELFLLKHNLKVSVNILKTAARQREVEQLAMRVKRLSPYKMATKEEAERIVGEALSEGK